MTATDTRPLLTDGDADLGYRIVTAVASEADTDPLDLDAPLYEAVDVGALERLLRTTGDATVSFRYAGYDVTVAGDGTVMVRDSPGADGNSVGE